MQKIISTKVSYVDVLAIIQYARPSEFIFLGIAANCTSDGFQNNKPAFSTEYRISAEFTINLRC